MEQAAIVEQNILKAIEDQVDEVISELNDVETLEKLRERRIAELKNEAKERQLLLAKGHGTYEELPEEKEFFNTLKNSDKVVVHFYRPEAARYKIFDRHLKILAAKHVEAKFVKLDISKCMFLAEKLKIQVLPMLLIIVDNKEADRIIGFTDLGNRDDFSTDVLEWRIAQSAVIKYDKDLRHPPEEDVPKSKTIINGAIRSTRTNDNSDDSD